MRRVVLLAVIILLAAIIVVWVRKDRAARWTAQALANPAASGSQAPNLSAAPDGSLILTWIEPSGADKAVRFAFWKSDHWTAPSTVIRSDDLQADSAAPPDVVKLENGALVAVWSQIKSSGKDEGNFLFASASTDGAKHWSTPVRIHSDTGVSEHSYESIAATEPDQATIIWLDSRDWDAKHTYRLMSTTVNSQGVLGIEKTVDADTCTCCPTAFVSTSKLSLAAYRGHNAQQIRDMKVVRLNQGNWSTPVTVHDDLWKINACPVNGPALSITGNRAAVLWFTGANDTPEVKIAMSDDSGATFRSPITLDSPKDETRPIGHVAVSLLDDGSALAVWLRHAAAGDEIVGERVTSKDQVSGRFTIGGGTGSDLGYPRLQKSSEAAMISWSDKNTHSVQTAIVNPAK